MGRVNIWVIYRGVVDQLRRSLNEVKRDNGKVTSRFIDKEIKEIIKDEEKYWKEGGYSIPENINMRKAKRHIMLMLKDDAYGQPANDYA